MSVNATFNVLITLVLIFWLKLFKQNVYSLEHCKDSEFCCAKTHKAETSYWSLVQDGVCVTESK